MTLRSMRSEHAIHAWSWVASARRVASNVSAVTDSVKANPPFDAFFDTSVSLRLTGPIVNWLGVFFERAYVAGPLRIRHAIHHINHGVPLCSASGSVRAR